MTKFLSSLDHFNKLISEKDAVIIYFSNSLCGACDVLEDKINVLLKTDYPNMEMYIVNTETHPEIAGQNRIFASPSLIIYFMGKEQARFLRSVGMSQIVEVIDRLYHV